MSSTERTLTIRYGEPRNQTRAIKMPEGDIVFESLRDGYATVYRFKGIRLVKTEDGTDVEKSALKVVWAKQTRSLTDYRIEGRMPPYDVDAIIEYERNPKMGTLKVDLSDIQSLRCDYRGKMRVTSHDYITDAVYSDDYDFGSEDEILDGGIPYYYDYGAFRMVVFLREKVDLSLSFEGAEATYKLRVFEREIADETGNLIKAFEYEFNFISFLRDGLFRLIKK